MGCAPFHIGFLKKANACCGIPQSKIRDFCQLPFTREPRAVPADQRAAGVNFARWLSANRYFPDPPGIVTAVQ